MFEPVYVIGAVAIAGILTLYLKFTKEPHSDKEKEN